ncbi:helix-turn-helix domain-containing protein [Amycolatopsis acidiphila]|uniref:Helix-turn-helix domain-containing protein n=2 Tax=Amycolatopsis acidiphila TaxID=715473 RepID=A0A558AGF9_9PSEU|nr:helix-turn-helix domain-containing protein [Amycolatopsis acidiphila]
MAGLAKGLAVLEAFSRATPKLTISDAARLTELNRAVARRCLLTLVELGYLTHDGKYFFPTPRMLRLADTYVESSALPQLAQRHLAAVREALQESASLAVLQDGESLFVARSEVLRIVNTGVRTGATLPAYASATGHVLLAGLTPEELESYLDTARPKARTPKTPTSAEEIRQRVEKARAEDVATTDEELELGLRSMAVPVRDSRGRTVAAMSVSAMASRVSVAQLYDEFLPVLRENADQLGRIL